MKVQAKCIMKAWDSTAAMMYEPGMGPLPGGLYELDFSQPNHRQLADLKTPRGEWIFEFDRSAVMGPASVHGAGMDILKKIGKYEVVGNPLGQGGMGVVYRAVDPEIGRPVAIKMMRSTVADNPELIDRFYREVKATALLRHPNIVTVYDWGKENGLPYIVMEFLEGSSLEGKTITAPSPYLAFSLQLNIVSQVCAGLHYAHEQGVVHRDIKPANIFLLKDQTVKIVDFGIAHLANKQVSSFTKPGQVIGTLFYMSPEQLQGSAIDRRTDIYSTGIVLYELLTNEVPFRGPDETSTRHQILMDPPPPLSTHLSEYPPELEEILNRALAKSPLDRYQTAEDFAFDLSRIQAQLKPSLIQEWMEGADAAIELSDWSRAREYLAEVLKLDPGHAGALEKLRELQGIVGEKLKVNEAQRLRAQAEDALAEQRIDDALNFAEQALNLDPSNPDLRFFRDSVRQRRERSAKAKRAADRAEACLKENQLDAALTAVNEALSWDDANAQAKELQAKIKQTLADSSNRKRLQDLLEKARKAIADGKHISALELLKQAEAIDRNAPELAALKRHATEGRQSGKPPKTNGEPAVSKIEFRSAPLEQSRPAAPRLESRPGGIDSSELETIRQLASVPPQGPPREKVKITPPPRVSGTFEPQRGSPAEPQRVGQASSDSAGAAVQKAQEVLVQRATVESIKDDSKRKDAKSRRLAEIVVGAIITLVVTVVGSYLVYYLTHEDTVNVTVETTPAGAAIQLAGKKNESCTAPCTKGLPEGTYELIASLPGYMQEDRKIEVSKNGTPTVQITLTPLPDKGHGPDQDQRRTVKLPPPPPPPAGQAATLIVQTPGIKGAVAFVDNNEYPLPDWQTRIQVDKNKPHVIRVQKDGYENSAERQVTIAKKEEKVVFDLKALPEIATVSLRKATPGALVLLDDRTVGAVSSNGSFETKTSPGSHTVQLTLDGRTSEKIEQQVAARSTVVIPSLTVAKRETPPPPPDKHEKKEIAEDKAPQNQVVPDYCPMPGKPSFNYDSPYRDKVGVWKGAWVEMVTKEGKKAAITKTRRFCVVITSFRGAEAQAIYSTESAPPQPNVKTDPASYRAVTGVVSGQGRDMTITFTTAGDSRVVALQFLNNGTVKANWSQPSVQFALNAWVTKVK